MKVVMIVSKEEIFKLGYTQDDLDKINDTYYVCNYRGEILYKKMLDVYMCLSNMKYSHNDIMVITRRIFGIFVYDGEMLRERMSELLSLGYSR